MRPKTQTQYWIVCGNFSLRSNNMGTHFNPEHLKILYVGILNPVPEAGQLIIGWSIRQHIFEKRLDVFPLGSVCP